MARRKLSSKQTLKAMKDIINNGGAKRQQQQVQLLEKDIHLEQDMFTEHNSIKQMFKVWVLKALALETHYQANRKNMVRTLAVETENELRRLGKEELVSHISEAIISLVKQANIRWSPIYIRRCLDEHYKNPSQRANALARQRHPGVPQDTGKTAEELEESLNRKSKSGWGQEYKVPTNAEYTEEIHSRKEYDKLTMLLRSLIQGEALPNRKTKYDVLMHVKIPLQVICRPAEQDAIVELDKEVMIRNAQDYKGVVVKDARDNTES